MSRILLLAGGLLIAALFVVNLFTKRQAGVKKSDTPGFFGLLFMVYGSSGCYLAVMLI